MSALRAALVAAGIDPDCRTEEVRAYLAGTPRKTSGGRPRSKDVRPRGQRWCRGCQQMLDLTWFTHGFPHQTGRDPLCQYCAAEADLEQESRDST